MNMMQHNLQVGDIDKEAAKDRKLFTQQPRESIIDSTKDEEETWKRELGRPTNWHSELLNLEQSKRPRLHHSCFTSQCSHAGLLPANERTEPRSPTREELTERLFRLSRLLNARETDIQRQVDFVDALHRERNMREFARQREREAGVRRQEEVASNLTHLLHARRSAYYLPDGLLPAPLHSSPAQSPWSATRHSSAELVCPAWTQGDLYPNPMVRWTVPPAAKEAPMSSSPIDPAPVTSEHVADDSHTQAARSYRPPPGKGLSLALDSDKAILSDFQILLRKSLEFFEVQPIDQANGIPGRKKDLEVGQVGIRCRYCAHRPPHWKGRGAVYYPRTLSAVYQAAQNMGMNHFMKSCTEMPQSVKDSFEAARLKQKQEIRRSGGKTYWTETTRHMDLEEHEGRNGIWFKGQPTSSTQGGARR